ncbi:MAG TPA: hypothetical protein VE973_04195, partial [Candidatus Limnocylindria bacterium]|nr:hypothetical protein [Candidatus Limnocylindria bacterium]
MFFATIPSLGKKPAEVPDIAKLEVTGGKLPLVIKQALAALNAKHELEIPGRGPLLETDIVVIENLQQWLIATGYIKIFPDKKDEIFHFDGFVMTKNPDGTPKALPRLPIYVRKDGN